MAPVKSGLFSESTTAPLRLTLLSSSIRRRARFKTRRSTNLWRADELPRRSTACFSLDAEMNFGMGLSLSERQAELTSLNVRVRSLTLIGASANSFYCTYHHV